MSEQLRRLVIEFGRYGIQTRVLYRSKYGPNPGAVRRRREAEQLRTRALESRLGGLRESVGASRLFGSGGHARCGGLPFFAQPIKQRPNNTDERST